MIDRDERPEDGDELPLGDQVGLAGFVDELRDLEHRPVDRELADLHVLDESEDHPANADDQSKQEQIVTGHPEEVHRAEVGDLQLRLARPRRRGDERCCQPPKTQRGSSERPPEREKQARPVQIGEAQYELRSRPYPPKQFPWGGMGLVNNRSRHTNSLASRGPRGRARREKRAAPGPPGGQRYQGAWKVSRRMCGRKRAESDLSTSAHIAQPPRHRRPLGPVPFSL